MNHKMKESERATWQNKLFLDKAVKQKCRIFYEENQVVVSPSELWEYLQNYRWKRMKKQSFSEKKNDIMSITFNDYFDYQRIRAQVHASQGFDWENINDLL